MCRKNLLSQIRQARQASKIAWGMWKFKQNLDNRIVVFVSPRVLALIGALSLHRLQYLGKWNQAGCIENEVNVCVRACFIFLFRFKFKLFGGICGRREPGRRKLCGMFPLACSGKLESYVRKVLKNYVCNSFPAWQQWTMVLWECECSAGMLRISGDISWSTLSAAEA